MHQTIKKMIMAAALTVFTLTVFSVCAPFSAFADEPAVMNVTVVEADDIEALQKPPGQDEALQKPSGQDEALQKPPGEDDALQTSSGDEEDSAGQTSSVEETSGKETPRRGGHAVYPELEENIDLNQGPGVKKEKEVPSGPERISLGQFRITGYCGCEQCCAGHGFTYSGTVPTPSHTISADLDRFPLGTKLEVNGIVYTVEDKGSSVTGDMIDIFYSTHEEALAKGTYTAEVFLVEHQTQK